MNNTNSMKTFAIIFLIVVAGMLVHILYSVVHVFILSFRSSKQIKRAKTTVDEQQEKTGNNEKNNIKKIKWKTTLNYCFFIFFKYLFIPLSILYVLVFFILFSYIWFSYEEISTNKIFLFILGVLFVVIFLFVILKEIYKDIKSWEIKIKKTKLLYNKRQKALNEAISRNRNLQNKKENG
ncbi:hypothetical protein [Mycoplasma yeatsii]|uniref:hypothetical protein n=1 Tax=Mycoplasma yeatsii TaxID=51365 RepID=UPI0005B24E33|nr:hypothetical protein [Mycoplasma yeatsii]AJM71552.1 hypothetical protein MYE_00275 [Mycoplasma yeatsii GM274B]